MVANLVVAEHAPLNLDVLAALVVIALVAAGSPELEKDLAEGRQWSCAFLAHPRARPDRGSARAHESAARLDCQSGCGLIRRPCYAQDGYSVSEGRRIGFGGVLTTVATAACLER